MKKTITIVLLCLSVLSFSQKVKLKKETVLVDDKVWLKYDGCTGLKYQLCSIYNLNGEEIIFFKFISQSSDHMLFNEYGDPNYYEVSFLGLNQKIEVREFIDDFLKKIFTAKIVNEDGSLNAEKVSRIVEKYGSSYSSNRKSNTNTIIIKEEPKSGVNINIGR
jgi:hypothetical protein